MVRCTPPRHLCARDALLVLLTGNMDKVTFAQVLEVQKWLMDPAACPTVWEPLLRIRRANPRFHRAYPRSDFPPERGRLGD